MRIYVDENIKMLLFLLINLFNFDYMHLTFEHSSCIRMRHYAIAHHICIRTHAEYELLYLFTQMFYTNGFIYLRSNFNL